eukprot:gene1090-1157_t
MMGVVRLILCSLILACSSTALDFCYSSYSDISTKQIVGSWRKGSHHENEGIFAHQRDLKEWWNHSCPVQSRVFSCRRHDLNETSGHGYEAYSQRFIPENCQLKGFDPFDFLNTLRNRQLAIIGDSISTQFFTMISCSLHGIVEAEYHLDWLPLVSIFGSDDCVASGEHCHISNSHIYYPKYNTTISLILDYGDPNLFNYYKIGHLTSNDIILMNRGVHVHREDRMIKELRTFFDQYLTDPISKRPMIIWRETSPQHFHTPNGHYDKETRYMPCQAYANHTLAYETDYYNRDADQWFSNFKQIPVMRIWNVTSIAWDQHILQQNRTDEENRQDCTHYCENSGVYYYWREILYNILPLVIQYRENSTNTRKTFKIMDS